MKKSCRISKIQHEAIVAEMIATGFEHKRETFPEMDYVQVTYTRKAKAETVYLRDQVFVMIEIYKRSGRTMRKLSGYVSTVGAADSQITSTLDVRLAIDRIKRIEAIKSK